MSHKYREEEIFRRIVSASNLLELEKTAKELIMECQRSRGETEQCSSYVKKAVDFIESNYGRDLSLDDVAGHVCISVGYLSILFKEEIGCTVLEYLTWVRMKKAKELLAEKDIKVKDIAKQLGYNSVQSFIRSFKKYYGYTPGVFNKNSKGEVDEPDTDFRGFSRRCRRECCVERIISSKSAQ